MEVQETPLNNILKVTLIILIVLSVGLGGFILLQLNNKKLTTRVIPTTKITPTVQQDNPANVDIGNVETDLKDIGVDVKNLQ